MIYFEKIVGLLFCSLIYFIGSSQELEPRALTNIPVGTNFLIAGYGFAKGNILLDPAIPIEDLNSNNHVTFAAYVRSINFFGLSAKVDAVIPFAMSDFEGNIDGDYNSSSKNGMGDIRIRLSFNFIGSRAMNSSDFSKYKSKQISGISIQLITPTGNYNSDDLINLGSNRWALRSQWGFSRSFVNWIVETYVGLWLFTDNNNFLNGNILSQKPLYTFKVHFIRELPRKMWISLNTGYGIGGRTSINGYQRDTEISTLRFGLIYALPLAKKHSLKFAYISGVRFNRGGDFDAVSISYQYRWNKKIKNK